MNYPLTDIIQDATRQIIKRKDDFIKECLCLKGFSYISDDPINNAKDMVCFIKEGWECYFVKDVFIIAIEQELKTTFDNTEFNKNTVKVEFNYSWSIPKFIHPLPSPTSHSSEQA